MAASNIFNVVETTIAEIHAAYRSGSLTARQLVQMYLDRIAAYDKQGPAINAVIALNARALDEADRLDAAFGENGFVGPLHGIPLIMKDQADMAGMPTTLGSVLFKDYVPDRDAFIVARLKQAGAIFIAKATLGELGGGDTHGSLFGSTVTDLANLLDCMVGYDAADPITAHGVGRAPESYAALLDADALKGARIGILRQPMGFRTEPDSDDFAKITEVFDRAVADLGAAGAEIVDPVVIPDLNALLDRRARDAEADDQAFTEYFAHATAPFATRQDAMASPLFDQVTQRGRDRWQTPQPADAHYDYLKARDTLMTRLLQVMADHRLDAIVHKAVEHQPTLIEDGVNPPFVDQKGAPHINTFLVFVPSVVVPAGFTRDDLPAGITFLGRPYDDANMIRLAYAYEQATHHRRAPATTP